MREDLKVKIALQSAAIAMNHIVSSIRELALADLAGIQEQYQERVNHHQRVIDHVKEAQKWIDTVANAYGEE